MAGHNGAATSIALRCADRVELTPRPPWGTNTRLWGEDMKRIIINLLAVAAGLWATAAVATPPDITPGKAKGKGVVIIQLDRSSDVLPMGTLWKLRAAWFDKAVQQPYVEGDADGGARNDTAFSIYTTDTGRRYLIARANAGRSILTQVEYQINWKMCLNAGSYSFNVPEDRYTYLGRLDPRWALRRIDGAIMSGLLVNYQDRRTLMNGQLDGFVPAGDAAELAQVEKDISALYEKAVTVTAGDTTPQTFALSQPHAAANKACWAWSSKDTRPEGFNGFRE